MAFDTAVLDPAGLRKFQALRGGAIESVTARFYADHASIYARFGQKGRDACTEDLGFHLEFLRPVLEFGLIQPMVDYLRWLASVLAARGIPAGHLPQSLDWLVDYFDANLGGLNAETVATAVQRIKARYQVPDAAVPAIYALMPGRWPECDAFETALLAGDRAGAGLLFDRCIEQGRTLVEVELHLIQPALYAIGRKWQNNEVSVAQEHLATAISQAVMASGRLRSEIPVSNGRRILLACVEGNNHSLGLQIVADAFQQSGWDVQYLGANVPTSALIAHAGEWKPELLGLSVSFAQQLRAVKEILAQLSSGRLTAPHTARPAVMIGGLAVNQFSSLADSLGADAWSPDARAAVASAAMLHAQPGLQ